MIKLFLILEKAKKKIAASFKQKQINKKMIYKIT